MIIITKFIKNVLNFALNLIDFRSKKLFKQSDKNTNVGLAHLEVASYQKKDAQELVEIKETITKCVKHA